MVTDSDVLSSDVSRHSIRRHLYEREEEYLWKGQEIRYGRDPVDVVLATIPARATLQPNQMPTEADGTARVGYLPSGVTLDVTFVRTAFPIARDQGSGNKASTHPVAPLA
jgi:hypothetical protein